MTVEKSVIVEKSVKKSLEKSVENSMEKSVFEVLVPPPFKKYNTCCAYLLLRLKLYLCICAVVYLYLGNK